MSDDDTASGASLTRADLDALMDKIWNEPPRMCGATEPHIVHPQAEGWTVCGNCMMPVRVRSLPDGRKMVDLGTHNPTEP